MKETEINNKKDPKAIQRGLKSGISRRAKRDKIKEQRDYARELVDKALKDGSVTLPVIVKSLLPLLDEWREAIRRGLKSENERTALAAAELFYGIVIEAPVKLPKQQAETTSLQVHAIKELEEIMRQRGHDEFKQKIQDAEERAERAIVVQVGDNAGGKTDYTEGGSRVSPPPGNIDTIDDIKYKEVKE